MRWLLRSVAGFCLPEATRRTAGPGHIVRAMVVLGGVAPGLALAADDVDRYQRLDQMHHTAWTARDGLTGRVNRIAQTADGYLWVGTGNGLYRFDGVAFEPFTPDSGALPAAGVDSLLVARDGGLWVGYIAGVVTYIGPDGDVVTYGAEQGLPVGSVRDIAEDQEGGVWVAAAGGLARLEGGRWHDVRKGWSYPCRSASRLLVGRDGTLWVGGASPARVVYLRKGSKQFEALGPESTFFGSVELPDGTVLLSNPLGGIVTAARRQADGSYTHHSVPTLVGHPRIVDGDGGVWLLSSEGLKRQRLAGTPAAPLSSSGSVELFTIRDGLSGRVPNALMLDREGNIWVGTDTGLDRFRRRNLTWKPDRRINGAASLVADRNGDVWVVTTAENGLTRADDGTPGPATPPRLDRAYLDPDGSVWLSGSGVFLRWADGRLERVPPPDELVARGYNYWVLSAARDGDGRLWAAVNGLGQFYLKDAQWTFVPILPGREDMTAIRAHVDGANRVWLVYPTEVASIDSGRVRVFSSADGLEVGPLLAVASRDSRALVGAEMGLAVEAGGRFHTVRTSDDRALGTVSDIHATREGIWLNTSIGIVLIPDSEASRLMQDPSHRVHIDVFDLVSDLPEALITRRRYITSTTTANGVVWFLTDSGIAKVDPRRIVRNTVAPPVAIRAVVADDKRYVARGVVMLPPLTRTLRIDYTALSLTIPERVRFRYRLEGWEDEWHDAGTRRSVFYTDLKPGRYAFRVLASNNDGVWNEEGATLAFVVAPAWYQTWWFSGLVLTALAGSIVALYRLRVRRVSAALSARFDERLAERTRIARELHDTLLQTVQGSKMVADNALDHVDDPAHMRRALEQLADWLHRGVHEGRAALNSLRASTVEVNDLADALRRAAEEPTRPAAMTVAIDIRGDSRHVHPIVRDEIYRIVYEAIRNAYAHSDATTLDVTLEYGRDLTIRVADNGSGMDPAVAASQKRGHFGLPGMRERAASIGATLDVATSPAGTSITLAVPGKSVYRT